MVFMALFSWPSASRTSVLSGYLGFDQMNLVKSLISTERFGVIRRHFCYCKTSLNCSSNSNFLMASRQNEAWYG